MRISITETLHIAVSAVWTNRFRSLLTILGIVIGITTVVTVSSLLTGLRKGIVDFFQEFGPNNMFLQRLSGDPSGNFAPPKERKRKPVLPEYAEIIKRQAPDVDDVAVSLYVPLSASASMTAKVPGFETGNILVNGITSNIIAIQPRDFLAGRIFTADEDARAARVAVIGSSLAEALYPTGKAVGRTFIVDGAEFLVIGVFGPAKGSFFGENQLDRQVLMPFQTARLRYPQSDLITFTIKAFPNKRDDAFDEVQSIVRRIRKTPPGVENDFNLSTADQIIQNFDKVTGMVVVVSIAISALGLLVGGIGVMNIMLVSVTERTREIGVRKAIGARRFDIIMQFLLEAISLTGLGGILGILFSVGVTLLIGVIFPSLPSQVPAWAIIAGFSVSVFVGVFFGVWPAVKASRLDPVEALRYE